MHDVPDTSSGAALAWLGPIRRRVRSAFFVLLRQALQTDDGRRILSETVPPPVVPGATLRAAEWALRAVPYKELGAAREMPAHPRSRSPIFITARFRTGSTLLWQIARDVPECRAYYEPFNERRWFDPLTRGSHTDETHTGITDYWREYEGLERLGELYDASWTDRDLFMDETSWNPAMRLYIEALVEAAAPSRAVLQFNRVDFRLPWLRHYFPTAVIVHLYRHPRDQWCSALLNHAPSIGPSSSIKEFESRDQFYLLSWVRDLRYRFPFLDERRWKHPYELFYLIWRLSWVYGRRYADYSMSYESLVTAPEEELSRLFRAVEVRHADPRRLSALVRGHAASRWREYASDDWFTSIESACETALTEYIGRTQSGRLGRAAGALASL
jgi:hypothetical protein